MIGLSNTPISIKYLTEKRQHNGALNQNTFAFYTEYQIINYTNEPIKLTLPHNVEHTLEPRHMSPDGNRRVVILVRETNGKREGNGVRESWEGNIIQCSVALKDIEELPIYVREINCVLSTMNISPCHPVNAKGELTDAANAAYVMLNKSFVSALFNIVANDPDERLHNLFTMVNNQICKVHIHRKPYLPSDCTICYRNRDGSEYIRETIPIDDILKDPDKIYVAPQSGTILAPSEHKLKETIDRQEMLNETMYSPVSVEQYKKDMKNKHQKELDSLQERISWAKNDLSIQKDKYDRTVARLNITIEEKDDEIALLNKRLAEYRADITARLEIDDHNLQREKVKTTIKNEEVRQNVADLKIQKEETVLMASKVSAWSTAAKAVAVIAPIAVGAVAWIVAPVFKSAALYACGIPPIPIIRGIATACITAICNAKEYVSDKIDDIKSSISNFVSDAWCGLMSVFC